MFTLVLLACAAPPEPQFEAAPAFVVVNRAPARPATACFNCSTCGTNCSCFGAGYYCAEGKCSPAAPIRPATAQSSFAAESVCVGGSCAAPGGIALGIGAVRGFAGTTRPLFRPFRRR